MRDKYGKKVNVGDWILYIPSYIFTQSLRTFKVYSIDGIGQRYEAIGCLIDESDDSDVVHFSSDEFEKLPSNENEREQYLFLKKLEML